VIRINCTAYVVGLLALNKSTQESANLRRGSCSPNITWSRSPPKSNHVLLVTHRTSYRHQPVLHLRSGFSALRMRTTSQSITGVFNLLKFVYYHVYYHQEEDPSKKFIRTQQLFRVSLLTERRTNRQKNAG